MPDYRELIEGVQNRGGPLWLKEDHSAFRGNITWIRFGPNDDNDSVMLDAIEDADMDSADIEDILCGVLRRDLVKRGFDVAHFEHAWESTEPHGPSHEVQVYKPLPGIRGHLPQRAHDALTAHLYAWLDAVPEAA